MSQEVIPRWGLPAVDFLKTDPETIKTEIIREYEKIANVTLAAGDPRRLFLLGLAATIIQLRTDVNYAAQQNLLSYAQGEYLDALGESIAVERLGASKAATTLRFTLSQALGNAFVIPAGFEVSAGEVTFSTDEECVIEPGDLTGDAPASCVQAGEVGNGFLAGQISTIVLPMAYLASAENLTESQGGTDVEGDPAYAERIRLRPDSFSVAGPGLFYIYYTKSYSPAIVDVAVTSPVAGEVDVYPLLEGGELPNETFLEGLLEHLSDETIRPLTDYVKTIAPTAVNYKIVVDYWVNRTDANKLETIQRAVTEAVESYRLWQQSKIGRDIVQDELIAKVNAAGAARIDRTTLLPVAFTALGATEVAQCTGVTVNFKGYKDE